MGPLDCTNKKAYDNLYSRNPYHLHIHHPCDRWICSSPSPMVWGEEEGEGDWGAIHPSRLYEGDEQQWAKFNG